MEILSLVWQIGIIALVAGALIGVMAYRLLAPSLKQATKDKAELDAARQELADYRNSVNQHFDKTSELMNDLAQNYVKVYQHLADGAHTLGDSKTFNKLLEQHPGRVSLTVDGESYAPGHDTDDRIVEAATSPDAAAESASGNAEIITDESAAVTATVEPAGDTTGITTTASSDEPGNPARATERALDAEALDESADREDTRTTADAGSVMSEDEEKAEVSRTVH